MAAWRRFVRRLYHVLRPATAEPDLAREVDAHLALLEDDFRERGMSDTEARRAARLSLGGADQTKERHRDARSLTWLDDLRRDTQYASRSLRRTPGFTFVAVLTLALGIGANTAIFSVVRAVLLNPLPYKNPERLVRLYENVPGAESSNGRSHRVGGLDIREIIEVRAHSHTLSNVTATGMGIALVSLAGGADDTRRELTAVSSNTFPVLGVQPMLGRWFTSKDEPPGDDKVIILSHDAWQRYFGGDPHAVGRPLAFNGNGFSQGVARGGTLGAAYTVVGVMPLGFHFPDDNTQFWVPVAVTPPADGRPSRATVLARLADGVSAEAAAAEVTAIVQAARGQPRKTESGTSGRPRFEFVRAQDEVGTSVKPALLVLTAAVGFVLLIACVNVANLLLARTAARQREIAVRVAIGAGRARLIRQLLTESLLLSLVGGAAGTMLAAGGVSLFRGLATDMARVDLGSLGTSFPRLDAIGIDAPVLAFAVATSLATSLIFGLIPALRQTRGAQMGVLRGASGTTSSAVIRGRFSVQGVLVVAEIAMAVLLFIGGGLLIHSFIKLAHVDSGYNPTNVLTFQASLPGTKTPAELNAFAEDLTTRMLAVPGVQSAAYANQLPLVALETSMLLGTTPELPSPARPPTNWADVRLVSRDYFKTLGIQVLVGRGFDEHDGVGQPRAIVINRTLAHRDFTDRTPVGTTVFVGRDVTPWTIVGVVEDVRQSGVDQAPRPQFFADLKQWTDSSIPILPFGAYYAIRTAADSSAVLAGIRNAMRQANDRASLENVATMDQIVSNGMTRPRMYAVLLGLFAGIAVVLAAAGIYGVMAYAVARRTREIGIRMALGARRAEVLGLVLRQSSLLTCSGIIVGFVAAAATTRYLQGLLFGLTPLDPATFVAVGVMFAFVATLASFIPARRATRVDPLTALRTE